MSEPAADPDFMDDFRTGLSTPSIAAIGATSGTVMLLGLLSTALAGPSWFMDGRVRWLAETDTDDAAFVSARMFDLDPFPPGAIVLLGASGMRESLTSAAALQEAVSTRLGREVPVIDLMMDGMTQIEAAMLAAEVTDRLEGRGGAPTTFVISLSPIIMQYPPDEMTAALKPPRLGLSNAVFDDELRRIGWAPPSHTGWPMIDFPRLYAIRLPQVPVNLLKGGIERRDHEYLGVRPRNRGELSFDWDKRVANLETWAPMNRGVVERMVERARAAGHEVVDLQNPLRTDIFGDAGEKAFFDLWFELERDLIGQLAVPVFTVDGAGIGPDDFADPVHLNNVEVQARVTAVVADQLAAHLAKR
ncbi:MAG: hypothetical protein R3F61_24520 [Myxococcota bacterium]